MNRLGVWPSSSRTRYWPSSSGSTNTSGVTGGTATLLKSAPGLGFSFRSSPSASWISSIE